MLVVFFYLKPLFFLYIHDAWSAIQYVLAAFAAGTYSWLIVSKETGNTHQKVCIGGRNNGKNEISDPTENERT